MMLKQELKIPSQRIDTIRDGVDHQSFRSKAGRRRCEPAQVLYLGGLNSLKGAKDLIEAFARLCVSHEAQLLIGGSGKYRSEERRVGKECRYRWAWEHVKKRNKK